jgi:hypothetical protein
MQQKKKVLFPAIIFGAIALQIFICVFVSLIFKNAIRVFVQRDDGKSNVPERAIYILEWCSSHRQWLNNIAEWFSNIAECFNNCFNNCFNGLGKQLRRKRTVERESHEFQAVQTDTGNDGMSSEQWALQTAMMVGAVGASSSSV